MRLGAAGVAILAACAASASAGETVDLAAVGIVAGDTLGSLSVRFDELDDLDEGCARSEAVASDSAFVLVLREQVGKLPSSEMYGFACLVIHAPGDLCSYDYPFRSIASFHPTIADVLCAIEGLPPDRVVGAWRLDGARVSLAHEAETVTETHETTRTKHRWRAP